MGTIQPDKKMDTQLKTAYEDNVSASFKDSLTGLFNHGFFHLLLNREISRSERYGESFAIALVDVDGFLTYNRRYGYLDGDRILKEIGAVLERSIRQVDLAARYSGDVFALLLTHSDSQSARAAIERIREAVETRYQGKLTVSAGLACYPGDSNESEGLLEKSHEALIQAKLRGKNRVHVIEQQNIPSELRKSKIMVVDDEPRNVKLLCALLQPLNHEVVTATNGEEALQLVSKADPDLILLDIMMPGMDGYEVCHRLKGKEATRLIPVILITALDDLEAKVKGIEVGADDFLTKPPNKAELMARVNSLLKIRALNRNLTSIENVLISLANAVEAKDAYTQGHTERVSDMAVSVGREMGVSGTEMDALRLGGILHDIGKIGVPREILNKPGRLNPEEWEFIKAHPATGYTICLPLKKTLGSALEVIRHHHEKIDGSGYPDRLQGEDISLSARIMAIVDIYDALVTDRPYRAGMSNEKAFCILRQEANEGKLDIKIVECLIGILGDQENRERSNG
jgi:putative two-component system response regulator